MADEGDNAPDLGIDRPSANLVEQYGLGRIRRGRELRSYRARSWEQAVIMLLVVLVASTLLVALLTRGH